MIRYKIGKLSHPVALAPGDYLKLTYSNMDGEECLHQEEVHTTKYYTHWLFMEIGDGIGDAIFMGDQRLHEWFLNQFPDAEKVEQDEPLFA